jgi:hypothetical protein
MSEPMSDPNSGNAPQARRVPLLPYVLYILAPQQVQAANFAGACLDPQQPWAFIQNLQMAQGLWGINVFRFSDWMERPDAFEVMAALNERDAAVAGHPDLLRLLPLPRAQPAADPASSAVDPAVDPNAPLDPNADPMSLPQRA